MLVLENFDLQKKQASTIFILKYTTAKTNNVLATFQQLNIIVGTHTVKERTCPKSYDQLDRKSEQFHFKLGARQNKTEQSLYSSAIG